MIADMFPVNMASVAHLKLHNKLRELRGLRYALLTRAFTRREFV